uniref:Cytochrome P450 n=1 Tax=Macrostomum lignano TaxID=282301 RepID=A0A1I8IKT1_9PLAT
MDDERRHSRMLPYGGFSRNFGGADRLSKVTHTIIAARHIAKKVTFSEDGRQDKSTDALYSIFNFFETITPPPKFPTFKDGFVHVSKVMKLHPQFQSGVLLRNVEEYGENISKKCTFN